VIREIIDDIVRNFDLEKFNKLFREKTRYWNFDFKSLPDEYDNDMFADGKKIGDFKTKINENDFEIIVAAYKVNKELTERSGKKAQYNLGKKILRDFNRYVGGFFIFYDNNGNFRFSFIYSIPKETGRLEFSNFKRYTYYVSKNLTNKTFIKQMKEADFSTFEGIIDAFSVEKVTKEFYEEIANWYFWALKEVEFPKDAEKEENGRNIAVIRLITRLIFLWFMREKGLISEELFDKEAISNYLKDLSDNETTYYTAILQNLFFATLNTPIKERKFRREKNINGYINQDYMNHKYFRHHKLFKNPDDMIQLFNNIPFLNGGLFECLDKSKDDESNDTGKEIRIDGFSDVKTKQPIIPNFLFFINEKTIDLSKDYNDKKYKKVKVRGILEILKSYNFTIDENIPTDEEVALDPELLGKVFENLLASYNPETATTARKATGSYYTPREIVDYMVETSLKEYFKNKLKDKILNLEEKINKLFSYSDEDEKNPFNEQETDEVINSIDELKVLDPAVGSGAFPMGVLHKLTFILGKLDPHNEKWKQKQIKAIESAVSDPDLKNELIKKVDEHFSTNELDYGRKLYIIQNCLYGVDIQPIAIQIAKLRFFISLLVDERIDKNAENYGIEPLPNLETKLVAANTLIGLDIDKGQLELQSLEVESYKKQLKEIRNKYFFEWNDKKKERLKKEDKNLREKLGKALKDGGWKIDKISPIITWDPYDTNKHSDWFNPEWMFGIKDGFDIVIANPPYIQLQKAYNNKLKYGDLYKDQGYEVFERMGDMYCLFYEKGIELLKVDGILSYITSNKWMRAGYGEKLRKFFINFNPLMLIDLGTNVFKCNNPKGPTVDTNILIIKKNINQNNLIAADLTVEISKNCKCVLSNLNNYILKKKLIINKLTKNAWFIGSNTEQRLKEKIEGIGKPLKLWDIQIYRGILTGLNDAFIITTEKRDEILKNCKNKDEFKRTDAIIKPILRGENIRRYYYEWANEWIIIIPAGWTNENRGREKPELFINRTYPSLMNYLKNFEFEAKKRYDRGDYWWELRPCNYYNEFEKEKVIWNRITDKIVFSFVQKNIYILDSNFMFTGKNLKYLIAILNSNTISNWIKKSTATLGGGNYGAKIYIEKCPIPLITVKNDYIVKQIESLVDKILASKKQHSQADTSKWEREINELVYKLYNLTPEEIKIIEEK